MSLKLEGKGIIFSPDFIDLISCQKIIRECIQFFSAIKIGNIYLYKYGIEVVKKIKEEFKIPVPVICDFKLMDIPDVAEEIMRIGVDNGVDGAMIWGLAGEETIARCIYSFQDMMVFLLTEYTHADVISEEIGNATAEMAIEHGAYGIQAPATRPERIAHLRRRIGKEMKIISCGVGYQKTPYGMAVKNGADFEIIGRSIYKSQNPVAEAEKAYLAIQEAI